MARRRKPIERWHTIAESPEDDFKRWDFLFEFSIIQHFRTNSPVPAEFNQEVRHEKKFVTISRTINSKTSAGSVFREWRK